MSSATQASPILFLRTPNLDKMRDPLSASWNIELTYKDSSITSGDDFDLAMLIDFAPMNETFSNYLEVVGLPVAIIDLNGKVLASSKWQRLCMEFHRENVVTLNRCLESDVFLSKQMQASKGYAIYRCRNGLTDCAAPIVVEGKHIANLFIGQFFLTPPDTAYFEKQCSDMGFDFDAYFEALSEVPIIGEGKVPAIMRLLVGIANQVAQQSLAAYRLKEVNDHLNQRNAALLEAKEVAESANRAKSLFLGNISHEIRTPVHQIAGISKIIRKGLTNDKQIKLLDSLDFATKRLDTIIGGVLTLVDLESGNKSLTLQPVNPNWIVQRAISLAGEQIQKKELQFCFIENVLPDGLLGDEESILTIAACYLNNAITFSERGIIEIHLEPISEDSEKILFRLTVKDEGIGITKDNKERLFEYFEQADNNHTRKYGGTGVGLAIVRKLARLMGGEVGCESEPGLGSTFWATFAMTKAARG